MIRLRQTQRNAVRLFGSLTSKSQLNSNIVLSDNVKEALSEKAAVVSLESAIITHGMPYPTNIETALEVEKIVKNEGAVPATIGFLNGKIHVGMNEAQICEMARAENRIKLSRYNLAEAVSKNLSGGTTVAATMLISKMCGIEFFVTGGIGGVHRAGELTMDVSADLRELGRTPVTVICAGIKSILDIPKTLEYLETEGVSVATIGASDEFPAFFTPSSGVRSPIHFRDQREALQFIDVHKSLQLDSGILLAVPIPEELAASTADIQCAIDTALKETEEKNVQGKHVTPYVLGRVNELTGGKSLVANIALVKHNATVGSQLAVEYHKKSGGEESSSSRRPVCK